MGNSEIDKKLDNLTKGLEVQDFNRVRQANLKEFYQQITPSEQTQFRDNNKRLELLKKMPEYKALTDKHEKLCRIADGLKEKVETNFKNYESRSFEFLAELDEFEQMKQQVFAKYSAS